MSSVSQDTFTLADDLVAKLYPFAGGLDAATDEEQIRWWTRGVLAVKLQELIDQAAQPLGPWQRYIGDYPSEDGRSRYSFHVVARSFPEAEHMAAGLGIRGEIKGVQPDAPLTVPMPKEEGFAHWVLHLVWRLMQHRRCSVDEFLHDRGTLHLVMHMHEDIPDDGRDDALVLGQYQDLCRSLYLLPAEYDYAGTPPLPVHP